MALLLLLATLLPPAVLTLSCHTCGDVRISGVETKPASDQDPTCTNVTLAGTEKECALEMDACYTLRMSLDVTDQNSAAPATTLLAGCGSSSDQWMKEKLSPRCKEQGMTCVNETCPKSLCNAVQIRGYELYEPAPYEAKKWLLPGIILSFLLLLILAMILMNVKERSDRYKMMIAEQTRRQEDGKTNGKVTQHFSLPPGIDISADVYPSKSMDA